MSIKSEERLQWWHEARFGMFIHWGLYASLAGEWNGKKTHGIGEWIMRDLHIPITEYEKLAEEFNPTKFDAEAWVDIAEHAGMKYLTITAKHHDGFCMFNAKTNPYNISSRSPFKRDPLKELADACNKRGIKMCFYYSQAQDWYAPGGAGHWEEESTEESNTHNHKPPQSLQNFQKYLDNIVKPDLKDLLSNYGPIGLIWFDTPVTINKKQSENLRDYVHELQPECLVSGRVGHGVGDYGSLGDNEHPAGRIEGAWETPATLNDTWGYKTDDHNWKSLEYLLELLVNCASKGVNYLLNVGPDDQGVIPQPSIDILKQIGDWLKRNAIAVYGTFQSPFLLDPEWGRITMRDNSIFLLVKNWKQKEIFLTGLHNKVLSTCILGNQSTNVSVSQDKDAVIITLPDEAPEKIYSVVELKLDGAPDVNQNIIQYRNHKIRLPVHTAKTDGSIEVANTGVTQNWKDIAAGKLTFNFEVKTPGNYRVIAVTRSHKDNPKNFGNHKIEITHENQSINEVIGVKDNDPIPPEGSFHYPQSIVGEIDISNAGMNKLQLEAKEIEDTRRGLTLFEIQLKKV